jgi:hypothetical protein
VHTHGGIGVQKITTREELERCRAGMPGPVYATRYVDYRAADGNYRKYRIIFIDRRPYPYHLAISADWMVHYYSAQMENFPWKLEEERHFLQDPESALGHAGWRAIEAVGKRLNLDYAGIDCSLLPDGRILVFEANPTMLVHPEAAAGPLGHKNPYIQRIFDAFEQMLLERIRPPAPGG